MYHTGKNYKISLAAAILGTVLNMALFVLAIIKDLYELYIIMSIALTLADGLLICGIVKDSKISTFYGLSIEIGNCIVMIFLGLISGSVWIGISILEFKLIMLSTLFLHYEGMKKQTSDYQMMREINQPIEVP